VRAVLLGGTDRDDQGGPAKQQLPDRAGRHLLYSPGATGLIHRPPWWLWLTLAAGVAAAEGLRRPSLPWVVVGALAVLGCLAALYPYGNWRRRGLAATLLGLIGTIAVTQGRLTAIETRWAEQRERRVQAASERLSGDLQAALHRADRLAQSALAAPQDDRRAAFQLLQRLVPKRGAEMSVTLLDPEGDVWAWAGRHRLPPVAEGDSLDSRATGYYVVLEARRHSDEGRIAVAGVLVWAHPAVPDRSRSVAELFREGTEVGLTVYPPGSAPDSVDVFDYEEPTTAGPRLLFSVRPVPPEQGTAKQRAYAGDIEIRKGSPSIRRAGCGRMSTGRSAATSSISSGRAGTTAGR
jgi:hypothetical protein